MAKNNVVETIDGLPLVAIDPGSSSFKLMAAEPVDPSCPEGSPLRILAADESCKYRCVKKGIIQNTTEASYMVRESMLLISNRIRHAVLPTAITLLGGKSMRCATLNSKRLLGKRGPISQNLLDNMREECFTKVNNYKSEHPVKALDVRVETFRLDDEEVPYEPEVGTQALQVEGRYSTFFGAPELLDRIHGSFERAGKSVEKAYARPVALLEALASEEDELMGLAIIDMGAETTTISVFKAGRFLSCRVMPQGGQNITLDIQQLGISAENAEKLKLRFGSAFEHPEDVKSVRVRAAKEGDEPVIVKTDFLSHIIVSRLDEMMHPVFEELKKYEDQIGRIYLTGGASKIADIIPYVQEHTSLPVEYGSHADWLDLDTPEAFYAPEYSATIGALLLGARYRREHPGQPIPGTTVKPDPKKTLGERLRSLFDGEEL